MRRQKDHIPDHLGQKILEIEFEIGIGNITKDLVEDAVKLYTEAIQINFKKAHEAGNEQQRMRNIKGCQFYQQKLKKMLKDPQVSKCLACQRTNIKRNYLQLKIDRQIVVNDAQKILQNYYENKVQQKRMIRRVIQDQRSQLQARIQHRERTRSMLAPKSESCTLDTNVSEQYI